MIPDAGGGARRRHGYSDSSKQIRVGCCRALDSRNWRASNGPVLAGVALWHDKRFRQAKA